MNKDTLLAIGIIGIPFMCIGAFIGGSIINESNKKCRDNAIGVWRDMAIFFKDQFVEEIKKNELLKKELGKK